MYVSAPADPSPSSTSNFIPELPRFSMCQIWHTMLELDAALGVEACALTLVALSDLLGTGHDPFVRP